MAHIPDGVLSTPVLAVGAVVAVSLIGVSLKRLDSASLPKVAVLAAVFFVISMITIPIGPSAVHPLASGLMGLILGLGAVPALAVALVLQAVFFGYGGLIVLGVNLTNLALPAVIVALLLKPRLQHCSSAKSAMMLGALSGLLATSLTGILVALSLFLSAGDYEFSAKVTFLTYLPLIAIETALSAAACSFLFKVKPEIFQIDAFSAVSGGTYAR